MGKFSILFVFTAFALFMGLNKQINDRIILVTDATTNHFASNQAKNIANSFAYMLLAKLGDDIAYRANVQTPVLSFGGQCTYRVSDTTIGGNQRIKIVVNAQYFGVNKQVEIIAQPPTPQSFMPAAVKAAITTNNNVETLGGLTVDGRNYTLNGTLIPGSGTLGIWTTRNYSQGGSSDVGGTKNGIDYAPSKPANANIISTSQVFPGGYPTTPEGILGGADNGFPANSLKTLAMSGVNGSQYTTNPATLKYPLNGITYVELPNGGQWNPANITGQGILIIHNTNLNASIKNINTGPFRGIVIADDIDKIHTDIIGAVCVISPNPPSGNCIGNGSGRVLYSTQAISLATSMSRPPQSSFGFGKTRIPIVSWYE